MLPKKNPQVDQKKNSLLYFTIGLALILFITWRAIELKSYGTNSFVDHQFLNVEDKDDVEIPITKELKTLPPPIPEPEVIKVVENKIEIDETPIKSTEINDDDVIDVNDVKIEEEDLDINVPFEIIEDVPIFPGCEKVSKSERRNCFQKKMNKHIRKNFHYPEIAQEMGIQGRVRASFIIDKDGSITKILVRGPDKNLEKEAQRIIGRLPKMTPGKQRGRPVRVPFSIPITFRLQ